MNISTLTDDVHFCSQIGQWYFDEWGDPDSSNGLENCIHYVKKQATNKGNLPLIFIAHEGEELLGAVELKIREHPNYPEYEYWLGGLYVSSSSRNKGIGGALIEYVKSKAIDLKLEELYLQCEQELVRMYEQYGFKKMHHARYGRFDTIIMRWDVR